jgi:hypothetical protein
MSQRPTVPAAESIEESAYQHVEMGLKSISEAREMVEMHNRLRAEFGER